MKNEMTVEEFLVLAKKAKDITVQVNKGDIQYKLYFDEANVKDCENSSSRIVIKANIKYSLRKQTMRANQCFASLI